MNEAAEQMQEKTAMMHATQKHSFEAPVSLPTGQEHSLLRLAFLLTGDPAVMASVTEILDTQNAADPFFQHWMTAWARKLVIAKALGAVHSQMAASLHRTRMRSGKKPPAWDSLPPPSFCAAHEVKSAHVENALLAIDLFPRCVLLLLMFEKLSLEDVAILLNTDQGLIKDAEEIALVELARNIAQEQGWTPQSAANA